MSVTIKDIAKKLNISISTVSYALNGGPRPVPSDVRDRVLATARELNYRPNALARSMATGRTDTLAVVPPGGAHPMLLSPYLLTVLNGIMEAAEANCQDILLHSLHFSNELLGTEQLSSEPTPNTTNSLLGGKVDGVILIAPPINSGLATQLALCNVPCMVFSSDGPSGTMTITIDNTLATGQAMEHLFALGHRHIAHVAGKHGQRDGDLRRTAYVQFLQEKELPCPPEWVVPGEFTYTKSFEFAHSLLTLPHRPTAVLASNDESGLAVIDAAHALGIRVPEDLSVIAFDLLPSPFQQRTLTSIHQPVHQMAVDAINLLIQWARSNKMPAPALRVYPTELIDHGTTAPVSINDQCL